MTKPEGPAQEPLCLCGHNEATHAVQVSTSGSRLHGCYVCSDCDHFVPATPAPSQPAAREWQKQLITGVDGDCLRAAFANCLGLPVEALPHFENDAWFNSWMAWFRERGIGLVWYGFRDGLSYDFPGLYVLSVKSPRLEGKKHCVVARDGKIVFDPHPDTENTTADPATANGAYLFTVLDAQQTAAKDAEIRELTFAKNTWSETAENYKTLLELAERERDSLREANARLAADLDAALKAEKDGQK